MYRTLTAIVIFFALLSPSQARHHKAQRAHYDTCVETNVMNPCYMQQTFGFRQQAPARQGRQATARPVYEVASAAPTRGQVIGGRPSGCPHAYCGCSASLRVFGKIIPSLNLAANWGRFPSAAPAPGMAAYKSGHVFVIESVNSDGTVVAHDGNSGHGLTRIHTVSLRGYRVVNPNG